MTVFVKSLLTDYSQAIGDFQRSSFGVYSGPSFPISLLSEAIGAADGLSTEDLVENVKAAVGSKRPSGGANALGNFLRSSLFNLAEGTVAERLRKIFEDYEEERAVAANVQQSAEGCGRAVDDVVYVSNSALTEMLTAVIPLINLLSMLLKRHPLARMIAPIISAIGAQLIDDTNRNVLSTCRERDDAIDTCFEEFERQCDQACQQPLPESAPKVAQCDVAPVQPAPPSPPSKGQEPPAPNASAPTNTSSTPCPPPAPPTKPAAMPAPAAEPPVVQPSPDCGTDNPGIKPLPPRPAVPVIPASIGQPSVSSSDCVGVLGAVGAGITRLAVDATVTAIGEIQVNIPPCPEPAAPPPEPAACVPPAPEPTPVMDNPCPEPEPENPCPEPEPEPEEPCPEPKNDAPPEPPVENRKTMEELAQVPEPEPPPKKMMPAAAEAPAPDLSASGEGEAAEIPASSGPSEVPEPPVEESSNDKPARARKAGQW